MTTPYDEFPDILPVEKYPLVFQARSTYDNRDPNMDHMARRSRDRQAKGLTQAILNNPKFFKGDPWSSKFPWVASVNLEVFLMTRKEWEEQMVAQYNKGVMAARSSPFTFPEIQESGK